MLDKPDIVQSDERFAIYAHGMLPLIEKKDEKISLAAASVLRKAALLEDAESAATYIDRYLLMADPTWTNDVARKVFADRFVKRPAIMPYFREVQQKIGKPEADAAK